MTALVYEREELPEVTKLSISTIEEEIRQGRFPKPRQLSPRKQGWLVEDIERWARAQEVVEPPAPRQPRERTELYRHFDAADRLLYVGISLSTVARLSQHMLGSPWAGEIARITVERFATREEAALAELRAIVEERPLHNIAGRVPDDA